MLFLDSKPNPGHNNTANYTLDDFQSLWRYIFVFNAIQKMTWDCSNFLQTVIHSRVPTYLFHFRACLWLLLLKQFGGNHVSRKVYLWNRFQSSVVYIRERLIPMDTKVNDPSLSQDLVTRKKLLIRSRAWGRRWTSIQSMF